MKSNLFWPIYKKIEEEFKELSYFICIDRKQLKIYSIKIADLILRIASECENISSELCKKENIKFRDKQGHVRKKIYFNEYMDKLNDCFNLEDKLVNPIYENIHEDTFCSKLTPFRKVKKRIDGKDKYVWGWYYAYTKIKHDRVKNFKEANIENLINALGALFLLNVYYKDEIFYSKKDYIIEVIIDKIQSYSDVFQVDYAMKSNDIDQVTKGKDSFFNAKRFMEVALPMSTYIIEYDKEHKTDSDVGADLLDELESSICVRQEDGSIVKKHQDYKLVDHKTLCAVVAIINKRY